MQYLVMLLLMIGSVKAGEIRLSFQPAEDIWRTNVYYRYITNKSNQYELDRHTPPVTNIYFDTGFRVVASGVEVGQKYDLLAPLFFTHTNIEWTSIGMIYTATNSVLVLPPIFSYHATNFLQHPINLVFILKQVQ